MQMSEKLPPDYALLCAESGWSKILTYILRTVPICVRYKPTDRYGPLDALCCSSPTEIQSSRCLPVSPAAILIEMLQASNPLLQEEGGGTAKQRED